MAAQTASAPNPAQSANATDSADLRARMVASLVEDGTIVSPAVVEAMRATLRERYALQVDLDEVYRLYSGVVTKRDEHGIAISSLSAPQVHGYMAEQAAIGAGMNVLEIGSGGPNAEILARLLGPSGRLTSMDIEPDVVDSARRSLTDAGFAHVDVVTGDGTHGCADHAPYDAILVTAQAAEIPSAWVEQLVEGGRLVIPLQIKGLPRVITFVRRGQVLVSTAARLFGFVPLRGDQPHNTTLVGIRDGEITIRFDDGLPVDPQQLRGVLDMSRIEVPSGACIGRSEPWADMQMWLATVMPGFCSVSIDPDKNTGLITPPGRHTSATAVVDGATLAYVTTAPAASEGEVEFVVHAFGGDAARLAREVADQLDVWARQVRGGAGPQFCAYPVDTPDEQLPEGRVVDKTTCRITISWPHMASGPGRNTDRATEQQGG